MDAGSTIRRLLIVRNDRLGDLILTLPAIALARQAFPEAHLAVLVAPNLATLFDGHWLLDATPPSTAAVARIHRSPESIAVRPLVDEVLTDDGIDSGWRLGRMLRAGEFDTALVINGSTRNSLAALAAGIPRRVCCTSKIAGLLCGNRRLFLRRSHPPIHEARFAAAFVGRLGVLVPEVLPLPNLPHDFAIERRVRQQIEAASGCAGPLFGIHPGSRGSAPNWPIERYAELANRLAEFGRVIVTGGRAEQPLLDRLAGHLLPERRERIGLFTNWSLLELIAALRQLQSLTVSSTGPMHVAGAVGTPCVALFSPHRSVCAEKWSPLGAGHTILTAPTGADGEIDMSHIPLADVLAANLGYLDRAAA